MIHSRELRRALGLAFTVTDGGGGAGDERAGLVAEVRDSVDRLYRLALRFTGDAAVAERVVLRTVERALNGASARRTEPDTAVWLAGLLRDICLTDHVAATAGPRGARPEPREHPHTEARDRLDELAARVDARIPRAVLLELIDTMPFDLREILVLGDLEGFQDDAVARITGLPSDTVSVRLRAARLGLERRVIRYLQAAA